MEIWPKQFELQPGLINGEAVFLLRFFDERAACLVEIGLTAATLVTLQDELRMRTDQILGIS